MGVKSIIYIYIAMVSVAAFAAPQPQLTEAPQIYKVWKDQQIVEAKNNVVRIANKITLARAGKLSEQELQALKPIERMDNDLRVAQENLQIAQELSVEDYFVVYLSRFRSHPDAIQSVASRMSKDEVAELIRAMLNRGEATTTQNGTILPGSNSATPSL